MTPGVSLHPWREPSGWRRSCAQSIKKVLAGTATSDTLSRWICGSGRQLAAAADLALGGVCAGCAGSPGLLCSACRAQLEQPARVLPRRPGGVPVAATCVYGGPVRNAVLAHKERGRLALARPLGDALSAAVSVWLDPPARGGAATNLQAALVPAPSSPGAVRRRGQDPLLRIARRACVTLRRAGFDCTLVPALRHRRRGVGSGRPWTRGPAGQSAGFDDHPDGCGGLACWPTGDRGRCRDDRCDDRRACPGPAGDRAGADWRRRDRCGAMRVSPEQLRVSPPPASG